MSDLQPAAWDSKYDEVDVERAVKQCLAVEETPIGRLLTPLIAPGSFLLEAGSGTGRILNFFTRDQRAEGVGIDYSPGGNELGRRTAARLSSSSTFVQGLLENMPFDEETFDLVFSDSVIEHLEDAVPAISEMARVMKRGGLIVVGVPNKLRPDGWDLYKARNKPPYIQNSFTPRRLRSMFEAQGLRTERMFGDTLVLVRNFRRDKPRPAAVTAGAQASPSSGRSWYRRLEGRLEPILPAGAWVNIGIVARKP